jgi:hypothetical protein
LHSSMLRTICWECCNFGDSSYSVLKQRFLQRESPARKHSWLWKRFIRNESPWKVTWIQCYWSLDNLKLTAQSLLKVTGLVTQLGWNRVASPTWSDRCRLYGSGLFYKQHDYGSGYSRFESCRGQTTFLSFKFKKKTSKSVFLNNRNQAIILTFLALRFSFQWLLLLKWLGPIIFSVNIR